jgi:hypothetical protein
MLQGGDDGRGYTVEIGVSIKWLIRRSPFLILIYCCAVWSWLWLEMNLYITWYRYCTTVLYAVLYTQYPYCMQSSVCFIKYVQKYDTLLCRYRYRTPPYQNCASAHIMRNATFRHRQLVLGVPSDTVSQ